VTTHATEHVTTADGLRLRIIAAGPEDGPTIILLHGFPEHWWGWRRQVAPLARAGFRVIVPDQRGYAGSDAPAGVRRYTLECLARDVLAIADAVDAPRFHLVGHDWGGIVAWAVAACHGERVEKLSILNAPHPDVVGGVMRRHPAQALRSSYIGFFQLTGVAEALLRARDHALLKRMMTATALPATFTADDLATYARQWARPGRLGAMLAYYRALIRRRGQQVGRVRPPTQILWGMKDKALSYPLAEASLGLCDQGSLIRFPAASHWLQHDEAEAVSAALIDFHGRP